MEAFIITKCEIRIYRNLYYYLLILKAPISYKKNKIESNTKQKSLRELGSNPRPQNSKSKGLSIAPHNSLRW